MRKSVKNRLANEAQSLKESQEARENSRELMNVYLAFAPFPRGHYIPKFRTDKFGNRIRQGQGKQDDTYNEEK